MLSKLIKKWKENSYYGFPLQREDQESPMPSKAPRRGVALLIALMTIMLMIAMVADMIVTSTVNLEMALASRDRVRAEFLAKSGFNFGLFMLMMSWGFDLYLAQSTVPAPLHRDLQDDGKSIWNMTRKLPPFGSLMVEMLNSGKKMVHEGEEESSELDDDDPFKLKGLMSEKIADTMKMFQDMFTINITDEASKINVNACYSGQCKETIDMLTALFSCPAEKAFLESKNLDPQRLAYRIKDFISNSANTSPESGLSDKNSPYLQQNPSYTTKGVPFDTVDELKLVDGWDDDIHAVFAPYLTVYPYPTGGTQTQFTTPININTIKAELLSCLIPDARSAACAESYAQKMYDIKKANDPVFQGDMKSTLSKIACLGTSTGSGSGQADLSWFDKKSSVFNIEVNSSTGKQSRKLIAVVRRLLPQDKTAPKDSKRAYQVLYWKLL